MQQWRRPDFLSEKKILFSSNEKTDYTLMVLFMLTAYHPSQ